MRADDDRQASDPCNCDQLRQQSRELLDAEAAHRGRPSIDNQARLGRARRTVEALLAKEHPR